MSRPIYLPTNFRHTTDDRYSPRFKPFNCESFKKKCKFKLSKGIPTSCTSPIDLELQTYLLWVVAKAQFWFRRNYINIWYMIIKMAESIQRQVYVLNNGYTSDWSTSLHATRHRYLPHMSRWQVYTKCDVLLSFKIVTQIAVGGFLSFHFADRWVATDSIAPLYCYSYTPVRLVLKRGGMWCHWQMMERWLVSWERVLKGGGVWWEKEEDVRYLPKVRPIVELESNQFSIRISTGTIDGDNLRRNRLNLVEILRYNELIKRRIVF